MMFPNQSPYSYSFNNPMSFKDPSGLAPEKKKGGKMKIQADVLAPIMESFLQAYAETLNTRMREFKPKYFMDGLEVPQELFESTSQYGLGSSGGGSGNSYGVGINGIGCGAGENVSNGVNGGGVLGNEATHSSANSNGTFLGSTPLHTPKNWSVSNINKSVSKANDALNVLHQGYPNREVGYFLRYNLVKNSLIADFFLGIDSDTWLNLNFNPYPIDKQLTIDEMIIGFVHLHTGLPHNFGPNDRKAISSLTLGYLIWTNVPNYSNNPNLYDKMFFGVMYHNNNDQFINDVLSWSNIHQSEINDFYHNVYNFGVSTFFLTQYFNTFGFEFKRGVK